MGDRKKKSGGRTLTDAGLVPFQVGLPPEVHKDLRRVFGIAGAHSMSAFATQAIVDAVTRALAKHKVEPTEKKS